VFPEKAVWLQVEHGRGALRSRRAVLVLFVSLIGALHPSCRRGESEGVAAESFRQGVYQFGAESMDQLAERAFEEMAWRFGTEQSQDPMWYAKARMRARVEASRFRVTFRRDRSVSVNGCVPWFPLREGEVTQWSVHGDSIELSARGIRTMELVAEAWGTVRLEGLPRRAPVWGSERAIRLLWCGGD
jgi:hypothetical protein